MTAEQIVDLLNEIHALDPKVLKPLIETRVPCNQAIVDHPTITVDGESPTGPCTVGLLGILEGIAGIDGKLIAMRSDQKTGDVVGFLVVPFETAKRKPVTHVPERYIPESSLRAVSATRTAELDAEIKMIKDAAQAWTPPASMEAKRIECACSEHVRFLTNQIVLRILVHRTPLDRSNYVVPLAAIVNIPRTWMGQPPGKFAEALHSILNSEGTFSPLAEAAILMNPVTMIDPVEGGSL